MHKTACALIILPLLGIGYLLFDGQVRLGAMINQIFPCTQVPMNSFPCYGVYEFWIMGILFCMSLLGFGLLVRTFFRHS